MPALRDELFAQPDLGADGGPPALVSDATAALAALYAKPGFPTDGFVALCDFGAGGTSVTLADAGSNFRADRPSVRYQEFSGDGIDQLILSHLLAVAPGVDTTDVSGTATRMGSVTRLLGRLPARQGTTVDGDGDDHPRSTAGQPGSGADVRLSRTEFEQLISGPLDRFVASMEEILQGNGIPRAKLAAFATAGGGASIPLITTRLSERWQPRLHLAATHVQRRNRRGGPRPGASVGGPRDQRRPHCRRTDQHRRRSRPRDQVSPTASANQAASAAANESASDNANLRPTVRWPGPKTPARATNRSLTRALPIMAGPQRLRISRRRETKTPTRPATPPNPSPAVVQARDPGVEPRRRGVAILVAVVLGLTLGPNKSKPVNTTSEPAPPPVPITTTVIGPNNSPTVTVITPPPVTTTTPAPGTTTTTQPTTTTSTTTTTSRRPQPQHHHHDSAAYHHNHPADDDFAGNDHRATDHHAKAADDDGGARHAHHQGAGGLTH